MIPFPRAWLLRRLRTFFFAQPVLFSSGSISLVSDGSVWFHWTLQQCLAQTSPAVCRWEFLFFPLPNFHEYLLPFLASLGSSPPHSGSIADIFQVFLLFAFASLPANRVHVRMSAAERGVPCSFGHWICRQSPTANFDRYWSNSSFLIDLFPTFFGDDHIEVWARFAECGG